MQRHGPGRDRGGEGQPGQRRGGPGQHHPGRLGGAERPHVHRDEGGVHRDPHRHEQQVPAEDVAGAQRRGLRRDVDPVPLDRAEHGVTRLAHGRVHRPGGQDGGSHEGQVAYPAEAGRPVPVHQGAQPESHRAQVEQRAEQAGPDAGPPDPPVHRHPALVRAEGRAMRTASRAGSASGRQSRRHQSSSRRPVSRRNTSSSVPRRTSEVSGSRPVERTAARASSPSVT